MKQITAALLILILTALAGLVGAQDSPGQAVTADDVNAVAKQMYCPVCENIPLDVCGTAACAQWRDEIRIQLESGSTPDEVIRDFVARYGDRVVGTPQDPTLRALSLVTPWIAAALVVALAVYLLLRWWRRQPLARAAAAGPTPPDDDDYRARLERDLQARR